MRRRLTLAGLAIGLISIGVVGGFELGAQGQTGRATAAGAPSAPADTAALRVSYEQWRKEYKTWGRWGPDDNKGTSNLITPQKVMSATRLVKNGIVVSLAHPGLNKPPPTSMRMVCSTERRTESPRAAHRHLSVSYGQTVAHMAPGVTPW